MTQRMKLGNVDAAVVARGVEVALPRLLHVRLILRGGANYIDR